MIHQKILFKKVSIILFAFILFIGCKKADSSDTGTNKTFSFNSLTVDGVHKGFAYTGASLTPQVRLTFSAPIKASSISNGISFKENATTAVSYNSSLENDNTTVVIQPTSPLKAFTSYNVSATDGLLSETDAKLSTRVDVLLTTGIDSTDKFPVITDDELLTLVQEQTFKYFWDFGHPVSGL